MSERAADWFGQAERDLAHARNARASSDQEWACFAAQQAAEKAVKAVILAHGGEPWGHSVLTLVRNLPKGLAVPDQLRDTARQLDKLYVPTRYPNGFDQGKPGDYFTEEDASRAIEQAESVLEFCRGHLPRP